MKAASDLIRRLHRSGVHLEARGDYLHVEAPKDTITSDLRALLVNRKADLLAELKTAGTRARLLAAATLEHVSPDLIHRLPKADIDFCEQLPENILKAYMRALKDEAERIAGRVPSQETAIIHCARCGPVWAPPEVAAALPVVDGTPRALGCPWCHIRKAGIQIPRPDNQVPGEGGA